MIKERLSKVLSISLLCLMGGVILCPSISYADTNTALVVQQTRTVKGLVSDELGPVAGATVIVKGTQNGVITNVNGEFTLSGVKVGDVIEVSYIGYATLSVKYNLSLIHI